MEKGKNLKKKRVVKPLNGSKEIIKRPSRIITISAITVLAIGLCLMPTSVLLTNIIQSEIDKGVSDEVKVPHPHTSKYEEWVSNDYDGAPKMYSTFYMWNLTNPDEFLAGNKPIYEEVGPFNFREMKHKYDIDFSDDKNEVKFKEYSTYIQDDTTNIKQIKITNVNPGFLGGVATAGGTDLQYNQLNFPFVLSQLRDQFYEIYATTMNATLSDDAWIEETQREILEDCSSLGLGELTEWLGTTVADIFLDCIDISTLRNFLLDGMPSSEEVFYAEWANDYFPDFEGNYTYLADNVNYIGGGLIELMGYHSDVENLMRTTLNDIDIQEKMNAIITKQGADLVDQSGSASGVGVDIEYNLYGETVGSESDLNIVNTTVIEGPQYSERFYEGIWFLLLYFPEGLGVEMNLDTYIVSGGSGLNYTQCATLWNDTDPDSLVRMDYETNKIWFKAANNDSDSKEYLKAKFNINDTQLEYILKWINISTTTWEPNVVEYTLNSWNSGVITTRTVEEWLFTAVDKAIYTYMNYSGKNVNRAKVNLFDNSHNIIEADENDIKTCKIKTGRDDISKVGQYVEYDHKDTIDIWLEPEEVEGTNGMQFAPGVNNDKKLKVFETDLMRVVRLEYKKDSKIYDINLYRYKLSDETFEPNPNYYMTTQGLINLQPVANYKGIEVRVSKPHLLDVDPSVQSKVIGMEPVKEDHETYIEVEPITGIVMNAKKKIQINFELTTSEFYYKNIANIVTPIVWFEQSGKITKELAEEFKDRVYGAERLKETLPLMVLGIGATLFTTGAVVTNRQFNKRRNFKSGTLTQDKIDKALKKLKSNLGEIPLSSPSPSEPENEAIPKATIEAIPKSTVEDIPKSDTK